MIFKPKLKQTGFLLNWFPVAAAATAAVNTFVILICHIGLALEDAADRPLRALALVLCQFGLVGVPEGAAVAEVLARLEHLAVLGLGAAGGAEGAAPAADEHVVPSVARLQNLIPSFPWIAPGWREWGRNPRKGRDQILQRSIAEP